MNGLQVLNSNKKNLFAYSSAIDYIRITRYFFYAISVVVLFSLHANVATGDMPQTDTVLHSIMYFTIGIIAATIANSTGAGGGIVFLPVFMGLGFSPLESLSTSIAIQCFGMSSGALAWLNYRKQELHNYTMQWQSLPSIIIISSSSSCLAIILIQRWLPHPPIDIELLFSLFSLIIGSIILTRTLKTKNEHIGRVRSLSFSEKITLFTISFIGGAMTAWISIGIGEVLLILLILLGFRLNVAVAAAVCVSAISVLIAIPHYFTLESVSLPVLIYAAPGALIGGVIARRLAIQLGAHKLKTAASGWIILSSTPYLIMSLP